MKKENPKAQVKDYYLILYKMEGHETWRAILSQDKGNLEIQATSNHWPKITAKQMFRIDRIAGTIINEDGK